jgi:transcription initiation factor TFIID subunit 6
MRRSRRTKLTTDDISCALRMRRMDVDSACQDIKRFATETLRLKGDDKELSLEDEENELEFEEKRIDIAVHWLSVDGHQPSIPQNPNFEETEITKRSKNHSIEVNEYLEEFEHILSQELELYINRITSAVLNSSEQVIERVMESVREDSGIHQLVPYFAQFICSEVILFQFILNSNIQKVIKNQRNGRVLLNVMKLTRALLESKHITLEPYVTSSYSLDL